MTEFIGEKSIASDKNTKIFFRIWNMNKKKILTNLKDHLLFDNLIIRFHIMPIECTWKQCYIFIRQNYQYKIIIKSERIWTRIKKEW